MSTPDRFDVAARAVLRHWQEWRLRHGVTEIVRESDCLVGLIAALARESMRVAVDDCVATVKAHCDCTHADVPGIVALNAPACGMYCAGCELCKNGAA